MSKWETNEEINIFRDYLRIPTKHPNVDYEPCVAFLQRQAENLGLPVIVDHPSGDDNVPVVIITWEGLKPNLPSIMLNSHMDVVAVEEHLWSYPPFAANIDENGRIFARGAQDMKCCGMWYLAAIRALKRENIRLERTVHVTFMPDEEIGSKLGMATLVKSDIFKRLNVGFEMDEGTACPSNYAPDSMFVFYAERTHSVIEFKCQGEAGHGSFMKDNSSWDKMQFMLDKFIQFRKREIKKLLDNPELPFGEVTAINLTQINGGVGRNVVPAEITFTIDIRLALEVDHDEFKRCIEQWCEGAGGGIEVNYVRMEPKVAATEIDSNNPFWVAFESAINELNLNIIKWICPGTTDARFIRQLNIPALGFSPMPNTDVKAHDSDEYVDADVYLNGIDIYKKILSNLGNVPPLDDF